MCHALAECVFKTFCHIRRTTQEFGWLKLTSNVGEVAKVSTFHKLHREEVIVTFGVNAVDRHNIFMRQFHAQFRFPMKMGNRLWVIKVSRAQNFQADYLAAWNSAAAKNSREAARRVLIHQLTVTQNQWLVFIAAKL